VDLFESIFKITNHNTTNIVGLNKELKAIYTNEIYDKNKQPMIIVTNSLYEANEFYQSLYNYNKNILFFPMDDFLTSEALAVNPGLKVKRIETLYSLINNKKQIVVTNLMGYLRFLPTVDMFKSKIIEIKKDQEYSINKLTRDLFNIGYKRETLINKTGEIAIRGFVIDIFPINYENPIRIEYWGDTVDSIRFFDINTQLSLSEMEDIVIVPNTEFLVNDSYDFLETHKDIVKHSSVINILKYLNKPIVIYDNYSQIETGYKFLLEEMYNYNISTNGNNNQKYMFELEELSAKQEVYFNEFDNHLLNADDHQTFKTSNVELFGGSMDSINQRLNDYVKTNKKVVICLGSEYKINKIIQMLENPNILFTNEKETYIGKINIIKKEINNGFIINDLVVIGEKEIFNKHDQKNIYKSNFKLGTKIRDLNKLNTGDYVVHSVHGIGRYAGIKTITKNGLNKDYLQIEYRNNDKLYIPAEKIDNISKYSSSDGVVPKINKLGGTEWQKTKIRARSRIKNIASELLKLYAIRESTQGFAFVKDDDNQINFENEFPYIETNDQLKAIEEIKRDMEKATPMDRLLCGDVGFGKTEVAFRAIFKAVLSGKQTMFLCPTTILASQHYNNAIERFKSFPINIAMLSRFVTPTKTKSIISALKEGKIDILIGTHRLLSNDVELKNLGLLIIDEEQRFGVEHKEKIKQFKNNIDVLSLSATPIPRTIQMSLAGIRSLSLIETPPVDRYPIQTYVLSENNQIIKDAIYKELSRHGQTFILYNNIEDMPNKATEISRLIPDAKVIYAHGKMGKTQIEDVMYKFINRDYDVLLCTTIIETGIDIPSANTLIIIDADHFGLSQLYQIRGRVGRSNKIAYCYLMYNKNKILSEIATKRLMVMKDFTELGSGFSIAMRDLSIRGAGDILGSEQAGFVDTIGIEMFLKMLNEEVNRLKGINIDDEIIDDKPLIEIATSVEDKYISDNDLKIEIHKQINKIDSYEMLTKVKIEIEDRFGKISDELLIYMYEEWFEKLAKKIGIKKVNQTKNFIEIIIDKELTSKIDGEKLFIAANKITRMFRFSIKLNRLHITLDTIKLEKHFVYYLIDLLLELKKSLKE
jgi:transcription-repair coupling factor (superfamily II helicase)